MKCKRLIGQKINKILRCFCADITATACAKITGVNRNTVNSLYSDFRHRIMLLVLAETRTGSGEFELDESYFGVRRMRGNEGRPAKLRSSGSSNAAERLSCASSLTARRLGNPFRRLGGLRRLDSQRLRPLPCLLQPERIRPRQKPCQRNRGRANFVCVEPRQAEARQVQRLLLGQIRGTVDGVRVEIQPPQ